MEDKYINAVKTLLEYIGEDPEREGLRETPERVLKAWSEFWGVGYKKKPEDVVKLFEDGGENFDEMILVKNIKVYSYCEHHLAPIIGVAHVAYIPDKKIIGLSKIARVVDIFARRLQVQERMTVQIAEALYRILECKGVAVYIEAEHLCMTSRGVREYDSLTATSKLIGVFLENEKTRKEFFDSIR